MSNNLNTEVSVLAWNVRDGLSEATRGQEIVDFISGQNPDAVVLSEAFRSNVSSDWEAQWLKELDRAGYGVTAASQEMFDSRPDQHAIVAAVKDRLVLDMRAIPLHARYAIQTLMRDPVTGQDYTVIGLHGNDKSEKDRLRDISALKDHVAKSPEIDPEALIVVGDLNTMSPNTAIARGLRAARPLARLLPAEAPDPDNPPTGLKRVGSLAQRLTDMATGTAMLQYEGMGLKDVDSQERPTMKKAGLAVKIDHILAGANFYSLTDRYQVHDPQYGTEDNDSLEDEDVPLSDHRAISATLRYIDADQDD